MADEDQGRQRPRRDGVGPDHPHRREPGHLHQDRLRHGQGGRVPQHVVDLPRLQHLHAGQRPARRALHHESHLRDLRRQPRDLLVLRAEHGVRRAPARARRADREPRRSRRVHVRPQHLPGEPGGGRLLREDGRRDQPGRARAGQPHRGAARRRARVQDHRRHHAVAEPVLRRVLPRGAAGEPLHARDVLPHGRPPRTPVDALPGRRRHHRDHPALHRLLHAAHALRGVHEARRADARRPVRLLLPGDARLRGERPPARPARLLGRVPRPRRLQLQLPRHDRVGPRDGRHPRCRRRRQARHQRPRRHQPRHPHPARSARSTTTGKTRRCS